MSIADRVRNSPTNIPASAKHDLHLRPHQLPSSTPASTTASTSVSTTNSNSNSPSDQHHQRQLQSESEEEMIGEGELEGSRTALLNQSNSATTSPVPIDSPTTRSYPLHSPSHHSSKSTTNTPLHKPHKECSGAGSPALSKLYLLQYRQQSDSSVMTRPHLQQPPPNPKSDQLTAPIEPLLAPLDCPRPTGSEPIDEDASSSLSRRTSFTHTATTDQPHALENWNQLRDDLRGQQLVIFLDYDGTLTPIVSQPSAAIINAPQREQLASVASKYPTAIVTGRKLDTIKNFILRGTPPSGLEHLYYAGSHGFDIDCPSATGEQNNKRVGEEFLPYLSEFRDQIQSKLKHIPGALVEDNIFSISVHYRNVSHENGDCDKLNELVDQCLKPYLEQGYLRKTKGQEVHEIRANFDWHKGAAVNYLMQLITKSDPSLSNRPSQDITPIYIGDDVTDEDAFRILRSYRTSQTHRHAIGIFVRTDDKVRPTDANYVLRDPDEVGQLLARLCEDL